MSAKRRNRVSSTVAIALALACGPAFAQTSSPAPTSASSAPATLGPITMAHASELFDNEKYAEAIAVLDAFIAEHPRDARAYVKRGDAKANLDREEDALRDYNTGLKIAPDYAYGYESRCQTRLDRGDSSGALEDCNTAIRLDDSLPRAYENRGDVYFDRDDYARAVTDYDLAIGHGDTSAYVYAARCDAERYVGKNSLAATDCEHALTIGPKNRRALWARGRLELAENDAVGGLADFNAYIALRPTGSASAYFFRGAAYNRVQKWALAIEDLDVYLKAYPKEGDGFAERGIAHAGLHQTQAAEADFATALKLYGRDAEESGVRRVTALIAALHANAPLVMPQL